MWQKTHIGKVSRTSFRTTSTYIDEIKSNLVVKRNPEEFTVWHDRLGHPDTTMMRKIIESSHGHPLKI